MKIFLQQLSEKDLDWDDSLSDEDKETWHKLIINLNKISSISVPRFIGGTESQLLCFCDLSSKAYATTIYLRTIQDGEVKVNLVFSKSRNAPKKELTIPRLELMATLIGVRSLRFVAKQLTSKTQIKCCVQILNVF